MIMNSSIKDIMNQQKFKYLKRTLEAKKGGLSLKNNLILELIERTKNEKYLNKILLDLNYPLEISLLFSYLLWNGYFSSSHNLCYCNKNNLNEPEFLSFEVMSGQGTCVHFSYLLKDFLKNCKYSNAILINQLKNIDYPNIYFPDIKRNAILAEEKAPQNKILSKLLETIIGNHAFNLINDCGNLFIYDVTNLLYIPITDCTYSKIKGEDIQGTLHPDFSYIFNLDDSSIQTMDFFYQKERGFYYNKDEYKMKSQELLTKLNDNQDILNDCYQESYEDIKIASNVARRIKSKNNLNQSICK